MNADGHRNDLDRAIDEAAAKLPQVDPPDHLWKRIETDLREVQRDHAADSAGAPRWLGLRLLFASRPRLALAGYGAILLLGLTAAVYLLTSRLDVAEQDIAAPVESNQLMDEARDDIDQAMFFYERAIEKLTVLAERNEKNLDPEYVAVQKEKIASLQTAITECKSALGQNRYHPDVQQYLLTAYIDLQNTLQEMASKNQSL